MDISDFIIFIINIVFFLINTVFLIGHVCSLFSNKSKLYEIDYALKEAQLIAEYPHYYDEHFIEVEENEKE